MSTKYVNTAELATHFGIANATVIAMMRSGEIPSGTYVRLGRVFRFDLKAIEEHLLTNSDLSEDDGRSSKGGAEAESTRLELPYELITEENHDE